MTFASDGLVSALVALLIQFVFKPILEIWISPDNRYHDTLVRTAAIILGVILSGVALLGAVVPVTGVAWLGFLGSGIVSGLTAIGAFHVLNGSTQPTTNKVP